MNKKIKVTLITLFVILAAIISGGYLYVSDYYHADSTAQTIQSQKNSNIITDGKLTILSPETPSETALIFYPGGKVEHTAYLPLLNRLRENGIMCILVEMPFRLAVLNQNAADSIFNKFPDIKNWYIGGHSLGGAMAGSYASSHPDKFKGLVLLGSYIYGDTPPSKALTIYGSEDHVLNKSKITYTQNIHEIQGGNHAQFGNYGFQKGDGTAAISAEQQQEETVNLILNFIK